MHPATPGLNEAVSVADGVTNPRQWHAEFLTYEGKVFIPQNKTSFIWD